ncbi:chemotaxis protein CheW [Rhodoplanes sp. SY1]|uniref:chemotaxis protein CheW n=1 Tax=Rhodoplanes sp. SY1 TaxID=3166646 RepID=UPI0038B5803C
MSFISHGISETEWSPYSFGGSEVNGGKGSIVTSSDEYDELHISIILIIENFRINRDLVEPMPTLLDNGNRDGDLQSICRLDDGRRLVSILATGRMFNANEMDGIVARAEGSKMAAESQIESTGDGDDEEQFVVFRLMDEEYGVSIEAVQEIVRVPDELTRIPKTPHFIEGVINLRGVVLPVIDQRRRFGLASTQRNDRQRIMVFTIHGVRTGFIVDQVSEVMRIPAKVIRPAPELSEEQKRMIRRVANLEQQKRMILLLEVTQLLDVNEVEGMATRH